MLVLIGAPVLLLPSRPVGVVGPKTVLVVACGAILAAGAALRWFSDRARGLPRSVGAPLAAVLAWAGVAAAASPWRYTALVGYPASRHGLVTIGAYAGVLVGAAATARSDVRRYLRVFWYGAGGIVLAYGMVQLHDRMGGWGGRWDPVPWGPAPPGWTIWSTTGNPNVMTGLLAMLLPVGLALLLEAGCERRRPRVRALCAAMVAVLVVELAVAGGRAGWLAALAGVVVMLGASRPFVPGARRVVAVTASASVLAVGTTLALAVSGNSKYRLGGLLATGPGTTVDLRLQLWRIAAHAGSAHPLVGLGPDGLAPAFFSYRTGVFVERFGVLSVATDPHNVILLWLVTTGVPGMVGFAWLLVASVRRVAERWDGTPPGDRVVQAGVVAALAAWLVQSLASPHDIALDACAWALLGLALADDASAHLPAQPPEPRHAVSGPMAILEH